MAQICSRVRVDVGHGRYRIIAGVVGDCPRAVAWLDRSGVLVSPGADLDEAIGNARAALDQRAAAESRRRRRPDLPTALEFEEALRVLHADADERALLFAHATAPEATADLAELAAATGLRCEGWVTVVYAGLAENLAKALGLEPDGLAVLGEPTRGRWQMHEEVRAALAVLAEE
jgi:integrase